MKINKINIIFSFSILAIFLLVSCSTKNIPKDFPKIENAYYKITTDSKEKYYQVQFELTNDLYIPEAIVINKIEQKIQPENKTGNQFSVNVIAESRQISGFKEKPSDQPNGLIFRKNNGEECFVPVNFKIK